MGKYLILEKGDYDDYTVDIIDITNSKLTKREMLKILNADSYAPYKVSGMIDGVVKVWRCLHLEQSAKESINAMFCCYDNREYKTVLDKKYTKEELLKIATANDNSGLAYWERELEGRYEEYSECYDIYQKLLTPPTTKSLTVDKENI